jgi:hypothetical protein
VPLLALALIVLVPLAVIALMPLILVVRYRVGTARRLARPWVASLNVMGMAASAVFFLVVAAMTGIWVATAPAAALAGMAVGGLLGAIGLRASRWEATPRSLHYTPNRWLVLAITLVVTARLIYGFWRAWMTLRADGDDTAIFAAFGVAGSLGAAAIVLGYYLVYGIGVRRRISRWQRAQREAARPPSPVQPSSIR